jgi:hypothetical protein
MSANNHRPHLLVLPEDDANRQILAGFRNYHAVNFRQMPIQNVARGWLNARDAILEEYVPTMRTYPNRHVLLVIDFDNHPARRDEIVAEIPHDLQERFFVIGSLDEPERLFAALSTRPEALGERLAADCDHGTRTTWSHEMLSHNTEEIQRLTLKVKPFLFV